MGEGAQPGKRQRSGADTASSSVPSQPFDRIPQYAYTTTIPPTHPPRTWVSGQAHAHLVPLAAAPLVHRSQRLGQLLGGQQDECVLWWRGWVSRVGGVSRVMGGG